MHLLLKSMGVGLVVILPATVIFYLFPKLIVNILFGPQFFEAVPYIGKFAVIMGLFSLIYITTFYNLSINKKRFIYILLAFNIIEIILIILFHASLMQIINILMFFMLVLFIILFSLTLSSKNGRTFNNNSRI